MKTLSALFFGLFFAASAFAVPADEHSEIRLDDIGGSMEHVEVRNQEAIGSCYAHVAAQIYDAWRFHHGKDTYYNHPSSGFEIGQRFKIRAAEMYEQKKQDSKISQLLSGLENETSIAAGSLTRTIPLLLKGGSCSQTELNAKFRGMTLDQYASKIMAIYNKYKKEYYALRADYRAANPAPDRRLQDNTRVSATDEYWRASDWRADVRNRATVLKKGKAELEAFNRKALANPSAKRIVWENLKADSDTVEVFKTISVASCSTDDRIMPNTNKFKIEKLTDSAKSFARIHSELDKGLAHAYPVGIMFCSSIFSEGLQFLVDKEKGGFKNKDEYWESPSCSPHFSLVIGRRRNPENNRRELLVRNTWGKKCSMLYSRDWTCEAEKGSLWIDEVTLRRAIYELNFVEPTNEWFSRFSK